MSTSSPATEAPFERELTATSPRLYVALGGSAGSLKALEAFFDSLGNAARDMCFLVVTHRGPDQDSLLSELLANHTDMPVEQIDGSVQAYAGHVYVIAPDSGLGMEQGRLVPEPNRDKQGQRATIDRFLESLAADQGDKAVAIILSGMGNDGTLGASAVHEAGGMTIAQAPAEAPYAEMPKKAIATGFIDQVLPAADMPDFLNSRPLDNSRTPANDSDDSESSDIDSQGTDTPEDTAPPPDSATERQLHDAILSLVKARHGRDFFHYKRGTISRRIARRMDITQAANLEDYLEQVRASRDESANLLGDLRIGVTGFFRDPEIFDVLEQHVIPSMIASTGQDEIPIRIWVPGCASGEEAYSLAIAFTEALQAIDSPRELQIFATDIDEPALANARHGFYNAQAVENIPVKRRARWFDRSEGGYRITSDLRARVIFAVQSVISDPPFSRLDMVSCRNLLIYLEKPMQRQVISLFHFALRDNGYLFLGSSENIDSQSPLFSSVRHGVHIYQARVQSNASHFRLDWMQNDPNPIARVPHIAQAHPGYDRRSFSEMIPRVLLGAFAPPSVVTNERFQLLYVHGDLGPYLGFPTGAPTDDVLRMARRGLETCLRSVIFTALSDKSEVTERSCVFCDDGSYEELEIRGRQFVPASDAPACVLISFHPIDDRLKTVRPMRSADGTADGEPDDYALHLEQTLKATRDDNRRLNDELQATRQEFQTTHEEALSINEELQSSNEELESSKEELQSLNEELNTVNTELKEKMEALREATADIENLLDSTDIATIFLDAEGLIKRFTPAAQRLFKLIRSDIGRPLSDISHVFDQPLDIATDAARVQDTREPMESEVRTRGGQWLLRRLTPYRTSQQDINGAVLSFLDVTALKQAERKAAAGDERFRAIYNDNPAMFFIVDEHGDISSVNDFGAQQLGYTCAELTGSSLQGLHAEPASLRQPLDQCNDKPGEIFRWERKLRRKDGEMIWIRANARRIDALGKDDSTSIFISCENITQERLLGEEAHFHATHDALTGLLNRREFERLLSLAMDSARHQDRSHTLAYLDLDNFKIINDSYGHEAGDELLRQITQRMRESLQQRDLLARIGGDEFALLMEDRDTDQARSLAKTIVDVIRSTDVLWKRQRLHVNTCIGLAPIHPGAGDVATVMRAADAACFAAKELGPGSVHEHSEQDLRVSRRRDAMNWAEQLQAALAEDRIELYVQPIVNLSDTNEPSGYECLMRLRTPDGQISLPGCFMEAANDYGLIRDLDRRALDLLLAFLKQHAHTLKPMRWIAVNLSATSLTHPEFLDTVSKALDDSGVDCRKICFEITETSVITNLSQAQHFMHELQKRGCSFALDDFGTGLSSFDYLRELPVQYVKIDGSFIRDMLEDAPDHAMVEAIVEISRMMGKETVAESVETPALLAAVQALGINYAQGFHFAQPASMNEVLLKP